MLYFRFGWLDFGFMLPLSLPSVRASTSESSGICTWHVSVNDVNDIKNNNDDI